MQHASAQVDLFTPQLIDVTPIEVADLPAATAPSASLKDKVILAIEGMIEQMRKGNSLLVLSSFGKDSGCLCTLAIIAIEWALRRGINVPHVVFGTSETEYENPVMNRGAQKEQAKLAHYIKAHKLPAEVISASPSLTNDYVVNMMGGRGVASMPGMDRNCSVQLKVSVGKRMKKMAKQRLKGNVINVVGKRWDESVSRGANMRASGERPDKPVVINGEPLLAPIAHLGYMDLWEVIGMVANGKGLFDGECLGNYSDFHGVMEDYRHANGGECEMLAMMGKKTQKTACDARSGCYVCQQVEEDRSLENMLTEFPGLRSLFDIRNWLGAIHFDPRRRRWLSREPNAAGELSIEPNAYSPDTCREMLRYYLSAQADEEIRAERAGEAPLFDVVPERKLIAIQLLWNRHGYHEPWAAIRDWKAVYEKGQRWYPDTNTPVADRASFPRPTKVRFPLSVVADGQSQLTNPAQMATAACSTSDAEVTSQVPLNDDGEFSVSQDGAECLIGFLSDELIAKSYHADTRPSDQIRTLLNLGTVKLRKGNVAYWERVMEIADTLAEQGVAAIIDDREALLHIGEKDGTFLQVA